ncbi:MAG: ribonuclease P protein subunit [Nitrososphaeria archaeon]
MLLLGKRVKVMGMGIQGTVVYETKNLLYISTEKGIRKVPKKGNTFINDKGKYLGDKLVGRPWERYDP